MSDEQEFQQPNDESTEEVGLNNDFTAPAAIAEMSDEDFANMSDDELFAAMNSSEAPAEKEEESESEETSEESEEEFEEEQEEAPEEQETEQEEEQEVEEEQENSDELDPVSKELFAPFKANGREITVNSVKDARTLMQMGANYNKKMSQLKPHLKNVRVLQDNDVSAEDLNFLLDLKNGNKDAIAKLLATHKLNPLDIDSVDDLNKDYKPEDRSISDTDYDLIDTTERLKDSPSYGKTVSIIKNDLDEASQKFFLSNPREIELLNEHVASGKYDRVMNIVESQKLLGNLNGMSDVEAYVSVSQALQTNEAADQSRGKSRANQEVGKKSDQHNANGLDAKELRKRASSPKNKGVPNSKDNEFNPLALDDKEFDKFFNSNFG